MRTSHRILIHAVVAAVALAAGSSFAQQTTGTPGSPSATTTPAPPHKFGGAIKDTAPQSKPYWPARIVPPKGAPNVLLIMTDDAGFGVPGTFGGVIPTPALEFDFKYEGLGTGTLAFSNFSGVGRGGTGTLKVDGEAVATQKMERTLPFTLQWDENLDIGSDTLTGVNDADYQPPFKFTGKLNKVTLTIDRPTLSPEDEKKLRAAQRNNRVSE